MKAAIHKQYSPPGIIEVKDLSKPIPKENEMLIKVVAATFNRTDWAKVSAKPFIIRCTMGLFKPKNPISGTDFAGVIEAIGIEVSSVTKTGNIIIKIAES